MQQNHRPGALKQTNKSHKHGKHRSKGTIDLANKGRVPVKAASKRNKRELSRDARRNKALQLRTKKREEVMMFKRKLGRAATPPFLTAIISLNPHEDVNEFLNMIRGSDSEAVVTSSQRHSLHISVPRFKQRFEFIVPAPGDLYAILDAVKVAETVLFLHSLEDDDDDDIVKNRETVLTALFGQGLPTTVHVVQGVSKVAIKKQTALKQLLSKRLEARFPKEKINFIDSAQDALLVLRKIGSQKMRSVHFRTRRSHLFAEEVHYEQCDEQTGGTLKISGYVREQPLDVNGLVHIPGLGDFQIRQIDVAPDPHPLVVKGNSRQDMPDGGVSVLRPDSNIQETLVIENEPNPMDGEQTWPTVEELEEAEERAKEAKKKVVRVPKGTSAYQAAWIIDDPEDDEDSDGDQIMSDLDENMSGSNESDLDASSRAPSVAVNTEENEEEYETLTLDGDKRENYDEDFDMDQEMDHLQKFKEERTDAMFPDEIDTPFDVPARVRFQKYRGLKSFRTSPWDPKENLPQDYARIFQFENFRRTRKKVYGLEREGAEPGMYVTLHVANVPKHLVDDRLLSADCPLVVFQPLAHEQKMSVLNVALKRTSFSQTVIASKERLIIHLGFRRYAVCPVLSYHSDRDINHKYERFFRNQTVMATFYAPITFTPAYALAFKEKSQGRQELVATGFLHSVNPDRIVAKRIVLSGHPYKINRRSVVVRYMFFTPDDILWFKPVELQTKYGRRGHIREPLGTHGHMKCVFDKPLMSQDTVLMNLYKRVYPKWTYDPIISNPAVLFENNQQRYTMMDFMT